MEIKLRPWKISDLANLVKYGNNSRVAANMTDGFPHPYTEQAGVAFIERVSIDTPLKVLAITYNDEAIGSVGIFPLQDIFRKNAELGYWIAEPFWNKGVATKAIGLMVNYGFDNFDLTRIFARPFGTNIGSQRALEKAGFILEARFENTFFKNGEFKDELVYAVRKPK